VEWGPGEGRTTARGREASWSAAALCRFQTRTRRLNRSNLIFKFRPLEFSTIRPRFSASAHLPFGSKFFFRSSAVTLLDTPSDGTSILAVQRIAFRTNLRTGSLPQFLW
jgi:hypothetical protein